LSGKNSNGRIWNGKILDDKILDDKTLRNKRLGHLARQAKMQGLKRAGEEAGTAGAVDVGLRAAPGKMQDAVDLPRRKRARGRCGKALGRDHAIDHRGDDRGGRLCKLDLAGAILAREIKKRPRARRQPGAQQLGEIVAIAIRALYVAKADGLRGLRGVTADREGGKLCELGAPGVGTDRARGVGAGHHHRGVGLLRDGAIERLHAQHGSEQDVVPARAQRARRALAVGGRPGYEKPHVFTRFFV
jgi:hypothetical protein